MLLCSMHPFLSYYHWFGRRVQKIQWGANLSKAVLTRQTHMQVAGSPAMIPATVPIRAVLSSQGCTMRNTHMCFLRQACYYRYNWRSWSVPVTKLQPLPAMVQEKACSHRDSTKTYSSMSKKADPLSSVLLRILNSPCHLIPVSHSCSQGAVTSF